VQLQTLQADPLPPALNLLQGPYASRRRGSRGWFVDLAGSAQFGKFRLAASLLVAALGVHVLATLADWGRLVYENKQLRGEMRQVFQATFPQTRAIVDPTLQMRRQLADLRRAHGYADTGDFLHALNALSGQVGGVNGMQYENARLTLLQPRATDLDGLRNTLQSQGYRLSIAGDPDRRTVILERSPQ
jgi:type II secretory pathway component PulL